MGPAFCKALRYAIVLQTQMFASTPGATVLHNVGLFPSLPIRITLKRTWFAVFAGRHRAGGYLICCSGYPPTHFGFQRGNIP